MTIQYTFAQKATSKKKPGVANTQNRIRNPLEQHTSKIISQISSRMRLNCGTKREFNQNARSYFSGNNLKQLYVQFFSMSIKTPAASADFCSSPVIIESLTDRQNQRT